MAIQFLCPGCRQPIEVDDVWAEKLVACPYCHKTVTAPGETTLDVNAAVPAAKPLATAAARPGEGAVLTGAPPGGERNLVALVGLGLTVGAWVLWGAGSLLLAPHYAELEAIMGKSFSEMQRAILERYGGSPPAWLLAGTLLPLLSLGLWLAGLICVGIGMRTAYRRVWATIGLGLSGMYAVVTCGSFLARAL